MYSVNKFQWLKILHIRHFVYKVIDIYVGSYEDGLM